MQWGNSTIQRQAFSRKLPGLLRYVGDKCSHILSSLSRVRRHQLACHSFTVIRHRYSHVWDTWHFCLQLIRHCPRKSIYGMWVFCGIKLSYLNSLYEFWKLIQSAISLFKLQKVKLIFYFFWRSQVPLHAMSLKVSPNDILINRAPRKWWRTNTCLSEYKQGLVSLFCGCNMGYISVLFVKFPFEKSSNTAELIYKLPFQSLFVLRLKA